MDQVLLVCQLFGLVIHAQLCTTKQKIPFAKDTFIGSPEYAQGQSTDTTAEPPIGA